MKKQLIFPMEEKYQEYLVDESKFTGEAQSISFPENEQEVLAIVKEMAEAGVPVTIQSGKTGIVGGAVPLGGHIMNLSRMKACVASGVREDGVYWIAVEPGINLTELNSEIQKQFRKTPVFWPPQPTETSAAVGGILASNAKGINACHYGDSRQYVEKIRMVQMDGTVREIRRGEKIQKIGEEVCDELDLILGGEGIYGIITQATLLLVEKPASIWGISFFFEEKEGAFAFAEGAKKIEDRKDAWVNAAEYLDRASINLIEQHKPVMTKIKELPDIDSQYTAMCYLELAGAEDGIEELAGDFMELAVACGSDPDKAWAVSGDSEIEKMRAFRHAAAETANLFIEEKRRNEPRITKLGTDIAQNRTCFGEMVHMYEGSLKKEGLKGCIFGHLLENHLHVNILSENITQYEKGKKLTEIWAKDAFASGGCAAVEHGIGKLKKTFCRELLSAERKEAMLQEKNLCDPAGLCNQGNIF